MRTLAAAVLSLSLAAAPAAARAGWFLEGSAGQGWEVKPGSAKQPTNLMLTPGFTLAEIVSVELGLLTSLANAQAAKVDVQLRPMVELGAPLFPLYAKGIVGIVGLKEKPVKLQYGGALGARFGLMGVGIFLEAGLLPTSVEVIGATGAKSSEWRWIAEGRLGLRLG